MAQSSQRHRYPIAVDLAVSVLTVPLLSGLVGARSLFQGITSLGQASEEVFRGERLPIIHLDQQTDENMND